MHDFRVDTRDPQEYIAILGKRRFEKLKRQIVYVWGNEDYYRQCFLKAGVTSPEDIRSLDDFRRLPAFLDKTSHRASQEESLRRYNHPFGLHLTAPLEKVVHIAATSGTTGQPTFYAFTRKDQEITNIILGRLFAAAGIQPGDTTFHAFGLSLWLAGITYVQALEAYGARPIAVGAEGGIPKILRYIEFTRPKALFATPSLLTQIIERAPYEIGKSAGDLGIGILVCTGEPGVGIKAFRDRVTEAFGAQVYDVTGGAWHNGTISCGGAEYHGMHHLGEDYVFRYDLVDPETKLPIDITDGAVGEAIHTALEYEAAPAFRSATGDILRIHVGECPHCGHFGTRMAIIGRADDLLNVKGAKVYPAAVQEVVAGFQPEVSGQIRIRLNGPPPRVDPPLKVVVEAGEGLAPHRWAEIARQIEQRIRDILAIRPQITMVPFGSLPRTGGKTKLIEIV
ncbi:MAG TPA: phenylacetate--CoA ligase family protein [Rhodospirillaceae bacterium]|nr:phenylacetate--CoA ligase family protein [Rhodospirillaceae bacterium]